MNSISIKAYGKINLGLDVLRRREDGYHEVKMIMQTVDIYDTLHMKKIDEDIIKLEVNVPNLEADESNLVYKAIKLIKGDKLYFGLNKNSNSKNLAPFSKRKRARFLELLVCFYV